ncbi:MAG: hypothetical protein OQK29_01250 [Ignavibacteriaceae bacterium]|nr:hypothetical protein [Ignavibacteriaceae bacterium]
MTEQQKETLKKFEQKLMDGMEPMPADFAKTINNNFWQLLDDDSSEQWERSLVEPVEG